jgi:glucose-6-phosphate 1-dehydrogenase
MNTKDYRDTPCNIVIIGASGDLSRRKLMPALFSLFCNDALPHRFTIFGYARTPMSDEAFREFAMRDLTCRYEADAADCSSLMETFLSHCHYVSGQYDDPAGIHALRDRIREVSTPEANALCYMAIPPSIFFDTARSLDEGGLASDLPEGFWSRVVLEKPFGRDSDSSKELISSIASIFEEEQTYRIDHYLGKEVIQNLLTLRFANRIFEPIWNREHIEKVSIAWSEQIGCEGRAGYFDNYGIIRDVVQNHLLQILALVAMEQPLSLEAVSIADEKARLLRAVEPLELNNLVVGQYAPAEVNGVSKPGYLTDPDVPNDSKTETYAKLMLRIRTPRWHGVPFHLEAGKALATKETIIRIRFRDVPYSIFAHDDQITANELVIRVQPDEAIELHVVNKKPGLTFDLQQADLNLLYSSKFNTILPDAYERLLLDVLKGDRSLFLRDDELAASWDIVTPALHKLERGELAARQYPYGSNGPSGELGC